MLIITRDAAEISNQRQQHPEGASSAKMEGSASLAEQSRPRKKQAGSASSRQLTPDEQAVAAALIVVVKRAMRGGREAALAAQQTLINNNPATQPFLKSLPADGPLPTMQHVEQTASKQLLESLTKLAKQCSAATCQPLEVFSRSVQCTTHKTGEPRLQAFWSQAGFNLKGKVQGRLENLLQTKMPQMVTCKDSPELVRGLQRLGVQESVVHLMNTFIMFVKMRQSPGYRANMLDDSDLNHMLPGELQRSSHWLDTAASLVPVSFSHSWLSSSVPCMPSSMRNGPLLFWHEITNLAGPSALIANHIRAGLAAQRHADRLQRCYTNCSQHICRRPGRSDGGRQLDLHTNWCPAPAAALHHSRPSGLPDPGCPMWAILCAHGPAGGCCARLVHPSSAPQ